MCDEVEKEFNKLWAKAELGDFMSKTELPTEDVEDNSDEDHAPYINVQEDTVPLQYNIFQGELPGHADARYHCSDQSVSSSIHLALCPGANQPTPFLYLG